MGWFSGVPTTKVNSRLGSHATTVHFVQYVGPRPLRFTWPRKRAPTSGPVEPSIHSASNVSGLKRPVLVTSLTRRHTRSGGASTCTVTESVGIGSGYGSAASAERDHLLARAAPIVFRRPRQVLEDAQRLRRATRNDAGVTVDGVTLALRLAAAGRRAADASRAGRSRSERADDPGHGPQATTVAARMRAIH